MIRFLLNLVVSFLAALIGIIVADIIFPGFQVKIGFSYFVVAGIYALLYALATPILRGMTERRARAFASGVALIATFVALFLTSLISGAFDIDGASTWIGATVVVWLFTALAAWLLPLLVFKRWMENRR